MKEKQKKEVLSPKELEIECVVREQTADKDVVKNKTKLKGYKGLKRLVPYYLKYKKSAILLCLSLICTSVLNYFIPIFNAKSLSSITSADFDNAILFVVISGSIYLVCNFISWFFNYIWIVMDNKVLYDMRQDIMKSVCDIKMSKIDKTNSGVFIDRIISDAGRCSDILLSIITVVVDLVANLCFLIYIAFLNVWLFLLMIAYVVVSYLLDEYRMRVWFRQNKEMRARREIVVGSYSEQVKGVRDIKSLNLKKEMLADSGEKFSYFLKKNLQERKQFYKNTFLLKNPLVEIIEILMLVVGMLLVKNNIVSFTTFIIVYMYKGRVVNLSSFISQIKQNATDGELCAQRFFEVVDEYPKEKFGDVSLTEPVRGDIKFENVYFSYNDEKEVLKGVSFEIEPNKTTAIVGKSGCGKSTILSLINNLYERNSGRISIDDIDIANLTEDSLRNTIGVVTQSPYIFNTSIKNNLLYVKPNATDDELWEVLRKSQIADFVKSTEKGLDSVVGESGVMLSGGQRQRLAIARVLLKGSKIIAFDEATSALDNQSQGAIVEELDNLKYDHTIIVVAHRLSTIVSADKIIVVDDGKKVAEGTHKELMKTSKIYKELYESEDTVTTVEEE